MIKKTFAIAILAVAAVFAVPAAAFAAGYVPDENISVSGPVVPGGSVNIGFASGSFDPGEPLTFAVTGDPDASFGIVRTGTVTTPGTSTASGAASVSVIIPANATGTYALTATGLTSGNVGRASLSVTPADTGSGGTGGGDGLSNTGASVPVLAFWIGGGALLLGGALIAVLAVARKQRSQV